MSIIPNSLNTLHLISLGATTGLRRNFFIKEPERNKGKFGKENNFFSKDKMKRLIKIIFAFSGIKI
jgi:hypothetical protein